MPQVLIDSATRQVLAFGVFPTAPPAGQEVAQVTDAEAAKQFQRGVKTLELNGTITVFLDPAIVAAEEAAAAAEAAKQTEKATAGGELSQQYQDAITRLNQIIDFVGTPTAAQVYDAVQDIALYLRKTLRYLEAQR